MLKSGHRVLTQVKVAKALLRSTLPPSRKVSKRLHAHLQTQNEKERRRRRKKLLIVSFLRSTTKVVSNATPLSRRKLLESFRPKELPLSSPSSQAAINVSTTERTSSLVISLVLARPLLSLSLLSKNSETGATSSAATLIFLPLSLHPLAS